MASPQIENGHTRIANELLEALAFVDFSGEEARLIFALLRKTYGFQKKLDFISNSQFVKATGLYKAHVSRGETRLTERKIVTRIGNKVGINKNYDEWLRKDKVTRIGNSVTRIGNKLLPELVDTKESKETIQKKLSAKAELLNNKNETMFGYNENKSYELPTLDIETGELSSSRKKDKAPSDKLRTYFYEQCYLHLKTRPKESPARDRTIAKSAIASLTKTQTKDLMAEWFASGKEAQDLIQITQCFSTVNINKFLANHTSHEQN